MQVLPHAYVGSEAVIGFGVIINTGAIVSHDCVLGEYANLSPGAILAGEVQVGSRALVGMGVTINLQVQDRRRGAHRQRRHDQDAMSPRTPSCGPASTWPD